MLIELNYPDPTPVTVPAEKTILVIVDMEKGTCDPRGSRWDDTRIPIIGPNVELLRRVREAGGRVIYTQSVRRPDALEFTIWTTQVRHLEGTWDVEIIDELKPLPGEPIVTKYTHDCFYKSNMDALLEQYGMRSGDGRVIVTGVAARSCVQAAVAQFSIRDYYVYVPMDCIGQPDEKEVLQALSFFNNTGQYNVTLTRSDLISLTPSAAATRQPQPAARA